MNVPEAFESFILLDGEKKITYENDPKMPHSAIFTFAKEDHTLGNLLKSQLLKSEDVIFAGYKIPHPFEHRFMLHVQTTPNKSPQDAVLSAIRELIADIDILKEKIKESLKR